MVEPINVLKAEQGNMVAPSLPRRGVFYLRVVVALVLIFVILKWVDFHYVIETLTTADIRYVLIVLGLAMLDRFLMSFKWALLLRARGILVSTSQAFAIYMASGFVGTFLPTGVGGDVFRTYRTTKSGSSLNDVAASVIMERAIGLVSAISLSLVALAYLSLGTEGPWVKVFSWTLIFFLLLLAAFFVTAHQRAFNIISRLLAGYEKLKPVRLFLESHRAYVELGRRRRILLVFFLLSFLEQGVLSVMNYTGAKAVGLSLPVIYFFALEPLTSLVGLIPISIGDIGIGEGAVIMLFALAGLSATQSFSMALIMRVIGWIMLIPAGLFFFFDFTQLRRSIRQLQDPSRK